MAIFAGAAAGSLVLFAAIALVVSLVLDRRRTGRRATGGGTILIR